MSGRRKKSSKRGENVKQVAVELFGDEVNLKVSKQTRQMVYRLLRNCDVNFLDRLIIFFFSSRVQTAWMRVFTKGMSSGYIMGRNEARRLLRRYEQHLRESSNGELPAEFRRRLNRFFGTSFGEERAEEGYEEE
jgi:hypothetical protein